MSTIDPSGGSPVGGVILDPSGSGGGDFLGPSAPPTGASIAATPGNARALGTYWKDQVSNYGKAFDAWIKRGEKVVDRYRDDRQLDKATKTRFNILWSNIQVLKPSLYGRAAKPEVSRRFRDHDPVGRVASQILERALAYEVQQFPDFDAAMTQAVEDRLLPGRGTVWVRYEPVIVEEALQPPEGSTQKPITTERVDACHSPVDYVYWQDFLHSPARTWEEITWIARRVWLSRAEGVKKFGKRFAVVPVGPVQNQQSTVTKHDALTERFIEKALVYEIWDKEKQTVCWIADKFPDALAEVDDPLKLEGFFPCPKPLYATMSNGTLVPVPDYCEYQDQAEELDMLTYRIDRIARAIKANGIYDNSFPELARLLNEGTDNKMFPSTNWAGLAEKGGLKGTVNLLDINVLIQAMGALSSSREQIINIIYQVAGISDIMRGSTKAEETLGAQQLKANFGSLRLRTPQTDVARFAADIFRLKAQLMANPELYPPELLVKMSGILETDDGKDQNIVLAALQLIGDSTIRDFHINVSSDTLAQIDEQAEHEAASELMTAVGGLMQQALPALQSAPELLPMMSELVKETFRCYKAGRNAEASVDQSFQLLSARLIKQAQNPGPSEAEIEARTQLQAAQMQAQVQAQAAQVKAQLDSQVQQGKLAMEAKLEAYKAQLEAQAAERDAHYKTMLQKMADDTERFNAELDSDTKLAIAGASAVTDMATTAVTASASQENASAEPAAKSPSKGGRNKIAQLFEQVQQMAPLVNELHGRKQRKGVNIIRDESGRILRGEDVYGD